MGRMEMGYEEGCTRGAKHQTAELWRPLLNGDPIGVALYLATVHALSHGPVSAPTPRF